MAPGRLKVYDTLTREWSQKTQEHIDSRYCYIFTRSDGKEIIRLGEFKDPSDEERFKMKEVKEFNDSISTALKRLKPSEIPESQLNDSHTMTMI